MRIKKPAAPLASCIMPTFNRPMFARRALSLFRAQKYPFKELIVVDDGLVPAGLEESEDVKIIRLEKKETIGRKHNLGAAAAQGTYLVHWDDDDWFGPLRLTRQLEPIALGRADITGLPANCIFRITDCTWWSFRRGYPRRDSRALFGWHDGTAAYHRRVWDAGVRYTDVDIREKRDFIHLARVAGFRELEVANEGDFVYIRHSGNTWTCPDSWMVEMVKPDFFTEDLLRSYGGIQ